MPKNRKQKTGVKKKPRSSARRKKASSGTATVDDSVLAAFAAIEQADTIVAYPEINLDEYANVAGERASIISIVKGLEEQVETAFKLKEVLEKELDAVQRKLSEESATRAELEAEISTLTAKASLVDQLREDVFFAEEEQNKVSTLLSATNQQLDVMTKQRDSLANEAASVKMRVKDLESEKMALEAQVLNFKDKAADMDRLHEGIMNLKEKLANADNRTADVCSQLEELQTENKELTQTKARLKNEIKKLNLKNEAAKKELNAFKKVMRDIRSEASRTSGRVRRRYFKQKNKK